MDRWLIEVRQTIRGLRRSPGFTAASVATLAIGIGATTAIFSLVHAALLQPLPYPEADRVVNLAFTIPASTSPTDEVSRSAAAPDTMFAWSYPKYETLQELDHPFAQLAGYQAFDMNLTGTERPERLSVEVVSATYFPLLDVQAEVGRVFSPEEDMTPATHPVALLSHDLWTRRYGANPDLLGRDIEINDVPLTVIGIMRDGFSGLSGTAQVWVPMMMSPPLTYDQRLEERWSHWHSVVGRLVPGIDIAQAEAALPGLARAIGQAHPSPSSGGPEWGMIARSLDAARMDPQLRRAAFVLFGAVGFVLLIGCVNVAGLLLARSKVRRREVAIRRAVGASRRHLVRQLLTESLVLSVIGGAAGALLAFWTTDALAAAVPTIAGADRISPLIDLTNVGVDLPVLGFALGVSLLTGLLFGLAPALGASDVPAAGALHGRDPTDGAQVGRDARGALIAAEVALALVLMIGAGLMVQSFAALRGVALGFESEHVLSFRLQPSASQVDMAGAPLFQRNLIDRLEQIPGVEGVGVNTCSPLSSGCMGSMVLRVDDRSLQDESRIPVGVHPVGGDYFGTLGVPLIRGRLFDQRDAADAPLVAVVSETAARRLWPEGDAIGGRLNVAMYPFGEDMAEVVGVVGDVKYRAVDAPTEPDVYIPSAHGARPRATIFVRTTADPLAVVPDIRTAVLETAPDLPVFDVVTLDERVADALARARFSALLLGLFGLVALGLAMVGIYGTIAYTVEQRRREIGVRMALGAQRTDVLALVVRGVVRPSVVGVAIGFVGAAALTRVLSGLLYGVGSLDVPTFIVVAAGLLAAALVAGIVPARRAAWTDPVVALRAE